MSAVSRSRSAVLASSVSGPPVALGYFKSPEQIAKAFVDNPFHPSFVMHVPAVISFACRRLYHLPWLPGYTSEDTRAQSGSRGD
jgi:hypothetical protein